MAWTVRLPDDEEAELARQAAAEGRSKQDITREALRLYLLRHRTWEEPFLSDEETFDFGGPVRKDGIRDIMRRSA